MVDVLISGDSDLNILIPYKLIKNRENGFMYLNT